MQFSQPDPGPCARLLQLWPQLWALILIPPATVAVASMSLPAAATAIVVLFGMAAVTTLAMTAESLRAVPVHLPAAGRFGVLATVTCMGFGGLFALSAPLACTAIVAYATTAAAAHNVPSPPGPPVAPPQESETATPEVHDVTPADVRRMTEEVRIMTDAELCQAWRGSYVTLTSARDLGRTAEVVMLRQLMLDEIEARHPNGLRAWLDSGARAAGGPDRFLDRPADAGPRNPPESAPRTGSPLD